MFSLICFWINDWVNNREAGDVKRYRTYYDVIVLAQWTSDDIFWHKHHWLFAHRLPTNSLLKGTITLSFDISIAVTANTLFNKQSNYRWFETPRLSYSSYVITVMRSRKFTTKQRSYPSPLWVVWGIVFLLMSIQCTLKTLWLMLDISKSSWSIYHSTDKKMSVWTNNTLM